jgi:hypothetical protein
LIKTDYEEGRLQPTPAGHPQLATLRANPFLLVIACFFLFMNPYIFRIYLNSLKETTPKKLVEPLLKCAGKSFTMEITTTMLVHDNEIKEFTCFTCRKRFPLISDLTRHLKTEHTLCVFSELGASLPGNVDPVVGPDKSTKEIDDDETSSNALKVHNLIKVKDSGPLLIPSAMTEGTNGEDAPNQVASPTVRQTMIINNITN